MNVACLEQLPLVFLIEDNGYAISVPVEKQTAGGNIANCWPVSRICCGWKWMGRILWRPIRRHAKPRWNTAARGRDRRWCMRTVTRPYSHSLSDDERLYKTKAERESEAARDPLLRFPTG